MSTGVTAASCAGGTNGSGMVKTTDNLEVYHLPHLCYVT